MRRDDKTVRWSTVTVYEFGVALGGSAVPRRGGPSVGLAAKPQSVWSVSLDAQDERRASKRKRGPKRPRADDEREEKPRSKPKRSKPKRVRWLKPLERVAMLERAGCSARQIERMMLESSDIAMSRRLSVAVARSAV